MAIWQYALLALGLVWLLQSVGVWFQARHYADVFKGVSNQFNDGFVGAGHTRGWVSGGAIAIIVVDPQMTVRRLLLMRGRSVFAKFRRVREVEGEALAAFREAQRAGVSKAEEKAIAQAVTQIDRVGRTP